VLTIHALSSGTLAALAEVHDGVLGCVHGVDLDFVEGVLDDLNGHGWCPLVDELSIGLRRAVPMPRRTVPRLACPSRLPSHRILHPVAPATSDRALLQK